VTPFEEGCSDAPRGGIACTGNVHPSWAYQGTWLGQRSTIRDVTEKAPEEHDTLEEAEAAVATAV